MNSRECGMPQKDGIAANLAEPTWSRPAVVGRYLAYLADIAQSIRQLQQAELAP